VLTVVYELDSKGGAVMAVMVLVSGYEWVTRLEE
jgi:hypothetical protein